MTTISDPKHPREAFVWIWLPGQTAPVVAGLIRAQESRFDFIYGRSYLDREDAISIYDPELPLRQEAFRPEPPLEIASALRDAAPDAWGRRVIAYQLFGGLEGAQDHRVDTIDELTFMLRSGSNRAGALDFQASPTDCIPRQAKSSTLEELITAAEHVDRGEVLAQDLAQALLHGSTIGGAMPKALIQDGETQYIAKFLYPTSLPYNLIKAEFVAMRLASLAGLDVAPVRLARSMDKDVLLVQRFDREQTNAGVVRRAMVSALTLSGLDERMAHYASYEDLADILRARSVAPKSALRELFSRMTFNILTGNTDDHARNHAAFWDGRQLALTPAYDVCPQPRLGHEASQLMRIHGRASRSQLSLCLAAAHKFLLSEEHALSIMRRQIAAIRKHFESVCNEAGMDDVSRSHLWRNQFLNDLAFRGLENRLAEVSTVGDPGR